MFHRSKFLQFNFADMDVMQFMVALDGPDSRPIFKCTLCNNLSRFKWSMERHMVLKHTEPTNDVCQYCSKVFKHKYYLDLHIRARECLSKMMFRAPQ